MPAETKTPSPELVDAIKRFTDTHNGRLYMPIAHPAFRDYPATRGTGRFDLIRPHLDRRGGTALDIGTHFGAFAHFLEDEGYRVTAVEHNELYVFISEQLRDLSGKKFEVIHGSVFEMKKPHYDVALALNIFHHFLKTEKRFKLLEAFLKRLKVKTIFFQAHDVEEKQMDDAYRNMDQDEFATFIAERTGMRQVIDIGNERKRTLYKMTR